LTNESASQRKRNEDGCNLDNEDGSSPGCVHWWDHGCASKASVVFQVGDGVASL
jgi:hypothetical protein